MILQQIFVAASQTSLLSTDEVLSIMVKKRIMKGNYMLLMSMMVTKGTMIHYKHRIRCPYSMGLENLILSSTITVFRVKENNILILLSFWETHHSV